MTAPDGPVETVDAVSVMGAKVMRGTWPDGERAVLISPADPYDTIDAQLSTEAGELPK